MDPVPGVGEHTERILGTLGYSASEIQRLRDEEVV
jgi:formyl-CoA transferase